MDEFFGVKPGMSARIAHHLDFAAYKLDELTAIGQLMMAQSRYYLSEAAIVDMTRPATGELSMAATTTPVELGPLVAAIRAAASAPSAR